MKKWKLYLKLFLSTFYMSACTFGGGYVIVPLMRKRFVDRLGWIDEKEMFDLVAIAQSSPGSIATNASIIVGYRVGGFLGAIVSMIGTILPPLILLSLVSLFYTAFQNNEVVRAVLNGMRIGVAAIIVSVVLKMGKDIFLTKNVVYVAIMLLAFAANWVLHLNVLYIILAAGLTGLVTSFVLHYRGRGKKWL